MDELKAGQVSSEAARAPELAAAQDAARRAEEQAEALRQAEEARKGEGALGPAQGGVARGVAGWSPGGG